MMDMMNATADSKLSAPAGRSRMGRMAARLGTLIGVLVVVFIGYCVAGWVRDMAMGMTMAKSEYQSVFLTNGQVYFGKLAFKGHWIELTDVYYLQVTEDLQSSSADAAAQDQSQQIQLVKLGNELHGPEDVMYIDKDKVLFWENMKDDAKVLQSIRQSKD